LRLGIDMDGVCSNWVRGSKEMLNERFANLNLNIYKESDTWDELEDLISKKQWSWLWTAGVERGLFARLPVFPGTHEALSYLSEKHDIFLLTCRPRLAGADTIWWVREHLDGINIQGVHLIKDKWKVPCDIYLDDKPENVIDISENSISATPVIRTRQYNKNLSWPFRVDGWEQFVRFVEERED
jgi:5'(3')-deoxyribonucleotidase